MPDDPALPATPISISTVLHGELGRFGSIADSGHATILTKLKD